MDEKLDNINQFLPTSCRIFTTLLYMKWMYRSSNCVWIEEVPPRLQDVLAHSVASLSVSYLAFHFLQMFIFPFSSLFLSFF